ncbi:outer membrane autotransporter protein [Ancylobacter polymorphus]|uniref:Outer membrane autotransporter protein n=1 Tax=Ancylobacter polymorphus TaxID=223390 RepID=A0ABU0BFN7_9HYPH|nr:autotransporter domain-containing protein [Ancylobacter polymorphus]MDQ0304647.1 outer membrane autotransporter protein [Ancylobacter polymorphus]
MSEEDFIFLASLTLTRRSLRCLLLASAAMMVAEAAQAQTITVPGTGGAGGGGAKGGESSIGPGDAGQNGMGTPAGAGGGGGSGSTGGNGGSVPNTPPVAGGAGGVPNATAGQAGGNGGYSGGGGGGGAHGFAGYGSSFVSGPYMGGNGGVGGNGGLYGGGGGGGGFGAAIVIQGTGETALDGQFYGGSAGGGGTGATAGGGGAGGAGLGIIDSDGGTIVLSSTTSAYGGAGGIGAGGTGSGGSGGAGLIVVNGQNATTLTSDAKLYGGIGGLAFNGALGGAGGSGLIIATSGASGSITANINGEVTGGAAGPSTGGSVPTGGNGGVGIYAGNGSSPSNSGVSYLNVNANVTGGAGGAGGIVNPFPAGGPGGGGAGIIGYNSTITVADGVTVSGGSGGVNSGIYEAAGIAGSDIQVVLQGTAQVKGGTRSNNLITIQGAAVAFDWGANTLELQADEIGNLPTLSGRVVHNEGTDTLVFGGAYDATMDAATLGPLANGFSSISKTGTSTWTLTGDLSASTPTWRLKQGTLSISDDKSLGGALTSVLLDGGTLAVTENVQTSRSFTLGNDVGEHGGTFAVAADKTLTIDSALAGAGTLTKTGAGKLTLTDANLTYWGAVTVSGGTLALSGAGGLGNAKSVTLGKATLDISGTTAGAKIKNLSSTEVTSRVVLGDKTLNVYMDSTLSFAGVLEGKGGLTVTSNGGSELWLSGDNTYEGATTVDNAFLSLGTGGSTGSVAGDITVDNTAMLIFNRSGTVTIANKINALFGTQLKFKGGGTFSYTGAGTISGSVVVDDATLLLNGNEFAGASSVTLREGSVLSGSGTVPTLLADAQSTVAPGLASGTLAAGDVFFYPNSSFKVSVAPSGEHSLITSTQTANLYGGTVEVVAAPGKYAADSRYAILTATGGVTGTFAGVTDDYAFLDAVLDYDPTNVYLLLHYTGVDFATYARTPNQLSTATAAQALGSGNAIYDALLMLPENAVPAAFDALSGEAYASVSSVLQQQSVYVRDAVSGRLRQALTAPGVSPLAYGPGPVKAQLAEGYAPTLWAQGYGGWGNTWSNGNAASISNTIGGFLMGADVAVAENARAGLFGGYSRSTFDVDGRSSSGSANNYDLGLYAGAQFGAVALRGGASYTWHDLSMSRSVVFPGFAESLKGKDTTGTAQVFGEIGYDVEVGAIAFEPFLGLAYVNVSGASLGEEGGAAALSVSTDDMSTVYSTLGVRLATTVEVGGRTLTPYATLGWQHAFGDVTPSSTMQFAGGLTPFSVSGVPVAEDALLVEAGLSYALSPTAQIGATYAGQLAGDASQNAFTAQFSLKF